MENQKNNNGLKATVAVLALSLAGSLGYNYKLSNEANVLTTEVSNVKTEKENVMADLQKLKDTYDAALAENTTMSDEIKAEREKVVGLMAQLEKSKGDAGTMAKYKQQYLGLQTKMNDLMQQVAVLTKKNETLTTNLDSTKVVLEDSKNIHKPIKPKRRISQNS